MFVQKRDGRHESVSFDKITARITKLSYGLNPDFCDPVRLTNIQKAPARCEQQSDCYKRLRCSWYLTHTRSS